MRYSRAHKASTRRRIVEGAAAAVRARGVAGVGVAELMRQAGLTHGGFYSHFPSKDALVAEAVAAAGEQSTRNLKRWSSGPAPGPASRRSPTRTCPPLIATSRTADARSPRSAASWRASPPSARRALSAQLEGLLDLLADHVPGRRGVSRRRQAMAALSCLVGAVVLSRAAENRETSDEILAAARRHLTGTS